MKRGSTLFLKVVIFLIGIPVLAFCVLVVPNIAEFASELYPDMGFFNYYVFAVFYASAVPFYLALYLSFQLLNYIDRNEAFSNLSVEALKKIKYSAGAFSMIYVTGMPLFYLVGEMDDAPGVILLGMILIFASMVIAVFAAVLEKLLKEAIHIKSENDLTV